MDDNIFCGELVRLDVLDPERDSLFFHQWAQDSQYLRLLDSSPAFPWPPKLTREFFEKHFNELFAFLIRVKTDDRPIGMINLSDISPGSVNCWVGVGIGPRDAWDKGYGTDAMRVILRYAFNELNLHRVSLNVFEYNPRALRSYEKCGFKIEGRERQWLKRDGRYYDLVFMGIIKQEWREWNRLQERAGN